MVITQKTGVFIFLCCVVAACSQPARKLPILGNPAVAGTDTAYPTIARFNFTDQDGNAISNHTFDNNIYVADFIFLSCPTICPKMTNAMQEVYLAYATDERVAFLSHSIDPENDTIQRLKAYANKLGVTANRWHFVRGNQDSILSLSEHSYFSTAYPDSTSPGGFTHSGGLLLVDKNRHIRGVYNSTKTSEIKRLIGDIQLLLKEQF